MSKFDKVYQKNYKQILKESPFQTGFHFPDEMDVESYNKEETESLIQKAKQKDEITVDGLILKLYREHETQPPFTDNWINKDQIIAQFILNPVEGGINSLGVWNSKKFKGTCRKLFFAYYLEKYNFVLSDTKHSTQGEEYWKKLIQTALQNNYKVFIIEDGNERQIESLDSESFSKIWGKDAKHHNIQIKITK